MNHFYKKVAAIIFFTTLPTIFLAVVFISNKNSAAETRVSELTRTPDTYGSNINPTGDPIGGGVGYSKIIDPANVNYIVHTKAELLSALTSATSGQIIYIDDNASIDLTDKKNLVIPTGVTLASGRGRNGSQGALLYSNYLVNSGPDAKRLFSLFKTGGNSVRVTGIRIKGPDNDNLSNPANERISWNYERAISSEHDLEVDNSELYYWGHSAVSILRNIPKKANIHHNYIHHNLRAGLGYGVSLGYGADALIEANKFDFNRHSIAGDGRPGDSYIARYNLVLGNGNSHAFDMHGGVDRRDGTDIAGRKVEIYYNTFYRIVLDNYPTPPKGYTSSCAAIRIRGIPTEGAWIHDNYFYYDYSKICVAQMANFGKIYVYNNCYNGVVENGIGNNGPWHVPPPCVSNWQCEQPLNGYESNGCGAVVNGGKRRTNAVCNPHER